MKARVISLEESTDGEAITLTAEIVKPHPPYYYAGSPEKEAAEYEQAYKAFEERLKEYEQLRLGSIDFQYEAESE